MASIQQLENAYKEVCEVRDQLKTALKSSQIKRGGKNQIKLASDEIDRIRGSFGECCGTIIKGDSRAAETFFSCFREIEYCFYHLDDCLNVLLSVARKRNKSKKKLINHLVKCWVFLEETCDEFSKSIEDEKERLKQELELGYTPRIITIYDLPYLGGYPSIGINQSLCQLPSYMDEEDFYDEDEDDGYDIYDYYAILDNDDSHLKTPTGAVRGGRKLSAYISGSSTTPTYTKYLPKGLQDDFYCEFGGIVLVYEKKLKASQKNTFILCKYRKIYFTPTAYINMDFLTLFEIDKLMRKSLEEGEDLILKKMKKKIEKREE